MKDTDHIAEDNHESWFAITRKKSGEFKRHLSKAVGEINALLSYQPHLSSGETPPQSGDAEVTQQTPNRFQKIIERIQYHRRFENRITADAPYGYFRDRHIIGEHTPICGGVYLGIKEQEALVVDEKYGTLNQVYTDLTLRIVKKFGTKLTNVAERQLVEEVINLCKEKLTYVTEDKLKPLIEIDDYEHDCKVALDIYLEHGLGSDRHQMILAAYLIEKLIKNGMMKGKIYLDGHLDLATNGQERFIYSSASGYLFVFTPAASYSTKLYSKAS